MSLTKATLIIVISIGSVVFWGNASAQDKTDDLLRQLVRRIALLSEQVDQLNEVNKIQNTQIQRLIKSEFKLKKKLACISSLSNGTEFIFDGCNVNIRNGAGKTTTTNAYGNLIIGYNENEVSLRTGSHNLILGDLNEYLSYGGVVSGTENTLAGPSSTILSGGENSANFNSGVILGSAQTIADTNSVILGGQQNYTASGAHFSVVVGGNDNTASGNRSVVVGGTLNEASGSNAVVCGGGENVASGNGAVVCGGSSNESSGLDTSISGGSHNLAVGRASSVSGGGYNTANGDYSSILGGNGVVLNNTYDTSP